MFSSNHDDIFGDDRKTHRPEARPGDWKCSKCRYTNRTYHQECRKCGTSSSSGNVVIDTQALTGGAPRKRIFVATERLESKDGINYSTSTRIPPATSTADAEGEDTSLMGRDLAKLDARQNGGGSLYDQLKANKSQMWDKKRAEEKEKWAPFKGLEEDECRFLEDVKAAKREKEKERKEKNATEMALFKLAVMSRIVKRSASPDQVDTGGSSSSRKSEGMDPEAASAPGSRLPMTVELKVTIKKRKRRGVVDSQVYARKVSKDAAGCSGKKALKVPALSCGPKAGAEGGAALPRGGAGGLVDVSSYGSSSDSSSESEAE